MASGDITRYVITVTFHEDSLTEINELNNHLTRSGFLLTLTDDEGNVHELGTNTFGFVSAQSADEIKALVAGLAKSALDKDVDITVATWEAWSKTHNKCHSRRGASAMCVSSYFSTAFLR